MDNPSTDDVAVVSGWASSECSTAGVVVATVDSRTQHPSSILHNQTDPPRTTLGVTKVASST